MKSYSELEMWDVLRHNNQEYVVTFCNPQHTCRIVHIENGRELPVIHLLGKEIHVIGKMEYKESKKPEPPESMLDEWARHSLR